MNTVETRPKEGSPAETRAKTGPKDIFLHLLAILTLYVSATSFLVLVFQYVNLWLPDPLEGDAFYQRTGALSAIRWALASLIIIFPVYVFTTRFLNKEYSSQPEKRELRTRKWLIYFTLFAAALIAIGDLITLLYHLLSGEITLRFIIKVISVLFVVGSIGYYYLTDLHRHRAVNS